MFQHRRKSSTWRALGNALLSLVLIASLAGCSDGGGDDEDGPTDAAADSTSDAAVDSTSDSDADATSDVSDAPEDVGDAEDIADLSDGGDTDDVIESGQATLTVLFEGDPVSDADVVVNRPDGSFANRMTTNSNGEAQFEIESGGSVTFATTSEMPIEFGKFYTVTQVQPGDSILLRTSEFPSTVGEAEVEMPGSFGEVAEGHVSIGCREEEDTSINGSTTLSVTEDCPQNGDKFDVLARIGGVFNELSAYSTERDVERDLLSTTQVQLPGWETDLLSFDLTVSGIPNDASVLVDLSLELDGVFFENRVAATQDVSGDSESYSLNYVPGFDATRHRVRLLYQDTSKTVTLEEMRRDEGSTSDKSFTLDASEMLPAVDTLESSNPSDAPPKVSWTTAPNGSGGTTIDAADAGVVMFSWGSKWHVVVPPETQEVSLPDLPTGMSISTDGDAPLTRVVLVDLPEYQDYADVRSQPPIQALYDDYLEGRPSGKLTRARMRP